MNKMWWPAKLSTAWEWQWGRVCFRYVHLKAARWSSVWNVVDRFSIYLEQKGD